MNDPRATLEFVQTVLHGRHRWLFRFRDADGRVVMESPPDFDSQDQAELAFVSLIKRVARNDYSVSTRKPIALSAFAAAPPAAIPVRSRTCGPRRHQCGHRFPDSFGRRPGTASDES